MYTTRKTTCKYYVKQLENITSFMTSRSSQAMMGYDG